MVGQEYPVVNNNGLKDDPVKRPHRISDEATYKEPVANTPVMINFFFSGI